jgi:hypothetical protein
MNASLRHRRLPLGILPDQPNPRLYHRVALVLRTGHDGRRSEQAHVHWNRRFLFGRQGDQDYDSLHESVELRRARQPVPLTDRERASGWRVGSLCGLRRQQKSGGDVAGRSRRKI